MIDPVEEWVASNRATFERMHHTLARANQKARSLTVAVQSSDGGVEVVVGNDRLIRDIRIDANKYQGYDERQLAALIIDALQHAKKRVTGAQWQLIDAEFGVAETGE
ncbi:MAG: YbaB/EbfC family nucleoid-associated protein [Micromonosporaceae bacterium]